MGASSPIPSDQSTQTLSVKLLRKAASFTSEGALIRQGDCFRIPRESMPSAEITSYKPTSRDLSAGCPTGLLPDRHSSGILGSAEHDDQRHPSCHTFGRGV